MTIKATNFIIECNTLKRKRLKIAGIVPKASLRPVYTTIITLQDTETGKEKGYRNKTLGTEIEVEILRIDPRQKDEEITTTLSKVTRMLATPS